LEPMGFVIDIARPGQTQTDALALLVTQPPADLGGEGDGIVEDRLRGRLGELARSGELRGDRGEALLLHLDAGLPSPRLVAAGLGKRDEVDRDALRTAGAAAAQALERVGGTVCWLLDERLPLPLADQAAALVEGTILGGYAP